MLGGLTCCDWTALTARVVLLALEVLAAVQAWCLCSVSAFCFVGLPIFPLHQATLVSFGGWVHINLTKFARFELLLTSSPKHRQESASTTVATRLPSPCCLDCLLTGSYAVCWSNHALKGEGRATKHHRRNRNPSTSQRKSIQTSKLVKLLQRVLHALTCSDCLCLVVYAQFEKKVASQATHVCCAITHTAHTHV